jgi:hypothetical protein
MERESEEAGSREDFAYGGITLYADDFHRLRLSTRFLTSCRVRPVENFANMTPEAPSSLLPASCVSQDTDQSFKARLLGCPA